MSVNEARSAYSKAVEAQQCCVNKAKAVNQFCNWHEETRNHTNKPVCETEARDQESSSWTENHAPFSTLFFLLNLSFFSTTVTLPVVEMRNFDYIFHQLKTICSTLDEA